MVPGPWTETLGVSYGLPAEEVGEGEGGPSEEAVEPAAGVVEGDLGGEACGEAVEGVGAVPVEAEVLDELAVDRFDDLAEAAEPAAEGRGPVPGRRAIGRADDAGAVVLGPAGVALGTDEAGVGQVGLVRGAAHAGERRPGRPPGGEEGFGQHLVLGVAGPEAVAGDDPVRVGRDQDREPLVP